ncbi:MAG: hypothetical protein COX37_02770 [Candidatus Nealsonbacteria bacterium CG23_combo_of_CG06-09_8_20_14_all_39_17]|uniref:dolichyl-phosphate beta-glucosyltransferase n=1 Tax=Candidatus Nealsonbacteria bacterium CG23_combo_of_CG06-09_8_20_14_all_39_17 TaxID=1974722 RepID=A0A2G9YU25_9BACT|nr:MAG: hypothetical protein COX37_02770 [Candidatus Nealsonbacteria bacterium CG23_combo_of_CG06-09_8_20_14_all_39_17]PIU44195.1 MAG: hypothetical protein COS96_00215 [Candidatus Nealsonbacteria bacterium CG07_land_8_20_14_0_80_39_13]
MYLSIIIPAYNEEKRIPSTLKEIDLYLRTQTYEYEIIVVNDGSKDGTAGVVNGLISEIKNLKLIDNKENHGKGFVTRQGLSEAKGEYRLFTDADNSTSIDQVEKMLPEFKKGYDIIIGSRDIKGAILIPAQPMIRRFLGEVFGFLTNFLCGTWGLMDTQCGFKGMTKGSVDKVIPKCRIDRFAFDPEILAVSKKFGFKIKEIPVTWKNDLASTVKFSGMVKMGLDLLKIRWNLISGKYNDKK